MNWLLRHLATAYIRIGIALACTLLPAEIAAQTTGPRITMQGPAENSGSAVIRNAAGKPCLDIEAAARAHTIDRDVLDHVVSVKNNCPRSIKVKICYLNSDSCNALDVQAYKRVDTILGTMRKVSNFRYTITQK